MAFTTEPPDCPKDQPEDLMLTIKVKIIRIIKKKQKLHILAVNKNKALSPEILWFSVA